MKLSTRKPVIAGTPDPTVSCHSSHESRIETDRTPRRRLKPFLDRTAALLLLPALLPFWAAIILLIKIDTPGPAIFRQTRTGRDGRRFTLYKFRSMTVDAERSSGPVWSHESDPRVTLVGGYLRRFGIDESPQIWNILNGEMSFVGPRPERPYFVDLLSREIRDYRRRLRVRPGVTGWAQVNRPHRSDFSVDDVQNKLEFDLHYIDRYTTGLDALIIFRTFHLLLSKLRWKPTKASFHSEASGLPAFTNQSTRSKSAVSHLEGS